jgi:PEP-CTERM motif
MIRSIRLSFFFALCASISSALVASPFASNILLTGGGTNVSFILNEDADALTYSINGGVDVSLTPTKGIHSFAIAPADLFAIKASKNETGYALPTGGSIAPVATGLSVATSQSGFKLISDDINPLVRFNSPRGVSVSNDPNAPQFGTAYVANSAAGNTTGVVRAVGDGMYAMRADQTDAFAYGNTAQDPGNKFDGAGASANSPFRVVVASNGEVYVSDFSDANGNIWRMNSAMTTDDQTLFGVGGPTAIPAGQFHGSTTAAYVEGSSAGGNLVMYTLDEDLTTFAATGAGSTTDKNALWRYDINGAAVPFTGAPTKVNVTNELVPLATSDLDRGADGKFYLGQFRSAGGEAGVVVLDASGNKLFDSLTASRTLLGNPTAVDILRNTQAIAVSPDQKWLAVMVNNSDVAVIPLVGGIPDLAGRLIVDTGTDVASGRDIAFDAADNIHYVSSGQALYRVLAPGGQTTAVTQWNGSSYSFSFAITVPEPASCMLMLFGLVAAIGCRRCASRC